MTTYANLCQNLGKHCAKNILPTWRSWRFSWSAILVLSLLFFEGMVRGQQEPLSAIAASWEGIPTDFTLEPPDPHGSAGPNGVLQVVNVRIEYWTKAGARIWGPTSFNTFFPW